MNDDTLLERPATGSRRQRGITLPLDQQSVSLFDSSDSTTLLPSRDRSAPNKPHPSATPTTHQDALQPEVLVRKNETLSTAGTSVPNVIPTNVAVHSTVSPDATLQQQLTQQQLLMQQQSLQLQQLSSELATSKMQLEQVKSAGESNSTQVKEKLQQELDLVRKQLKELQEELHEEKMVSSKLKACYCVVTIMK